MKNVIRPKTCAFKIKTSIPNNNISLNLNTRESKITKFDKPWFVPNIDNFVIETEEKQLETYSIYDMPEEEMKELFDKYGAVFDAKEIIKIICTSQTKEEIYDKINNSINKDPEKLKKYNRINLSKNITDYAIKFVGNPYVFGGNSLTDGIDCSGFVQQVYRQYGVELPRNSRSQAQIGELVNLDDIEAGDLVFYGYGGYVSHVGIYIGDGKIVHAYNPNVGIVISPVQLYEPIITVKRVL